MLRTVIILIIILVTVVSLDIVGVSYSFDIDFDRTFNGQKCDERPEWTLVEYESVGVAAPSNSSRAIRASSDSCASSFPIILIPGSILEFYVFLETATTKSGVEIVVFNEDVLVGKYVYNRSVKGFVPGWSKVTLPVEEKGVGYINLLGYSEDCEIVLVDSFRYTPYTSKTEDNDDEALLFVAHEHEDRNVSIELIETIDNRAEDNRDGSGDSINDLDEPPPPNEITLGPWAITLIAVASVTGLGLLIVGAYHLGKVNGLAVNPPFIDVEPASTVTIPRVRGIRESSIESISRRWENW